MISVSIIGHNEERNIERCLESVKWVDEIIFVDCESTDKTAEIVNRYTKNVFSCDNNPNLNVNKQFGIEQCKNSWILYLDPDEVVSGNLKKEILSIVQIEDNEIKGYFIPRKNHYFGKFLKYGGKYPDYQLRLFRNGFAKFPCKHVHERINVEGKVRKLESPLLHYPYSDISDMLKKSNFYTSRKGEYWFSKNKKSKFILLQSLIKFFKLYIFKFGFLDGFTGFTVATMDSYNEFVSLLKLKEIRDRG
ncbi:MAG: hypothetical protein A2474_00885 [Elusimicrobia bacterium RIFOXYC2_FULL_34_12]|nr:MAG: hypothetical protein A2474_00885 [Elusimicrobia bacterium RIFOXYC2_FULL_34_12]OGS38877.1 MAG: hypothetical protein A2551_03375 [Elusimicrobia bacterium RIFOXYD2_FULL_34_30]HAM39051.1 glycosyltransferase family 2 protein [Elusimicrobiota bacterium]